ncbi:MAG: histidinol dehydrogenase [Aminipila sp.]
MIKILEYNQTSFEKFATFKPSSSDLIDSVRAIINQVKLDGDTAIFKFNKQFDKYSLQELEVSEQEIQTALSLVSPQFIKVLKKSAENIKSFHKKQIRNSFIISESSGVITGQKITPLDRVGLYIPGGTANYPSSVLMNCIPAKIAGVSEIIMVTPAKEGIVSPNILTAAKIAGVDRIFKVGGAQAIAALAYGTNTIPPVDKIVGPGNAYVAEAKKQVFGAVDIDMIAGPSEILIIADDSCNPTYIASDILSQAEHDTMSSPILITTSSYLADAVSLEIERQLAALPRKDIARQSIDNNGKIIVTNSIEDAVNLSNEIAPEHLEICLDNPFDYLDKIKHAGSIFLGKNCPEALGDYFAGPNHTLPTSGTARFFSPLSVDDFVKKSQYTYYSKDALSKVAEDVACFAREEGLEAHARSVLVRVKDNI